MDFATSDLHFGHPNIIKYCNRPFRDVDEMNRRLVELWQETVGWDDTVYVLGDVAMGDVEMSLRHVARLPGRKILVAGNHDRCWSHRPHADEWREIYLAAGFEDIVDEHRIVLAGEMVRMHHFPYSGDSHGKDRYVSARPVDDGGWLLCGHVHDAWTVAGRQINVGCDVWGYRPVQLDVLAGIISGTD